MIPFNLQCVLIGLCGTVISTLAVLYSLSKKAKAANVIFKTKNYFETDWFSPVISVIAIFMALILLPYAPKNWSPLVILILFATIGYTGNDLVSRFFSIVNTRINSAIDYKTDIADKATGNFGTPTPAMPAKKTEVPPPSKN